MYNKRVWSSHKNHSRFFRGAQKRGISTIVATVLVILITVAAVTIVWAAIIPMIRDNLEMGTACLDADVFIDAGSGWTCYDAEKKIVAVQVKKGAKDVNISKIEFLLGSGGTSNKITTSFNLDSNSGKTFYIPVADNVEEVGIAPVVVLGNKEKSCDVTSKVKLGECDLSSEANLNLLLSGSLINSDSWIVGTGSVTGYSKNGGTSENVREFGIGPYGNSVLLWKAVPDSVSGADGGWNGASISIDSTKTYRSTVWIKKTGSNGGSTYFGCYGPSTNRLNGVANSNPYFWAGDLPELNKWYLLVGYIHGSSDSSTTSYGGIYDGETGEKVVSMTDYKNKPSATIQVHRTYLYYDTTTMDRQYFWNPTFTEVSNFDLPIEI